MTGTMLNYMDLPGKYYVFVSSDGKCLIKLGAEESLVIKCDHNGKILKMHGSEYIKTEALMNIHTRIHDEFMKMYNEFGSRVDRLINRLIEEHEIK